MLLLFGSAATATTEATKATGRTSAPAATIAATLVHLLLGFRRKSAGGEPGGVAFGVGPALGAGYLDERFLTHFRVCDVRRPSDRTGGVFP